jgi:hypothetical protein
MDPGWRKIRILDPQKTFHYISKSLVTNIKIKNALTNKFSGIRDPVPFRPWIRDRHPGSATLGCNINSHGVSSDLGDESEISGQMNQLLVSVPVHVGLNHRLNMELDLQSFFSHSCFNWLRPRNSPPPPPPAFGLIYENDIGQPG